ncbi:MAG: hypothetical protein JWP35_3711 [Caulobacter sp.]|jgi:hypothetical protein|nr:hypothetical protein [Caulobacter sp.]
MVTAMAAFSVAILKFLAAGLAELARSGVRI